MNRAPSEEGRPSPAKYSTPAIAADTAKDFLAEVARACPAIRPYLHRLALADRYMEHAVNGPITHEPSLKLMLDWRQVRAKT